MTSSCAVETSLLCCGIRWFMRNQVAVYSSVREAIKHAHYQPLSSTD